MNSHSAAYEQPFSSLGTAAQQLMNSCSAAYEQPLCSFYKCAQQFMNSSSAARTQTQIIGRRNLKITAVV
jgi:hypothetical protein